jgi:hypothetical protein
MSSERSKKIKFYSNLQEVQVDQQKVVLEDLVGQEVVEVQGALYVKSN